MNSVAHQYLAFQERSWLTTRRDLALGFLDRLMDSVARFNAGDISRFRLEARLTRLSIRLARMQERVVATAHFLPDGQELGLWLEGLQFYRWGLREIEVYLTEPAPEQAAQARRALDAGTARLGEALRRAYTRLGYDEEGRPAG